MGRDDWRQSLKVNATDRSECDHCCGSLLDHERYCPAEPLLDSIERRISEADEELLTRLIDGRERPAGPGEAVLLRAVRRLLGDRDGALLALDQAVAENQQLREQCAESLRERDRLREGPGYRKLRDMEQHLVIARGAIDNLERVNQHLREENTGNLVEIERLTAEKARVAEIARERLEEVIENARAQHADLEADLGRVEALIELEHDDSTVRVGRIRAALKGE